jgi:hypothetical protein
VIVSSPATARRAVVVHEQEQPDSSLSGDRKRFMGQLQTWKQVAVAELLNWLERGHFDLKPLR